MLGESLYSSIQPSLQWALKLLFKELCVITGNFATYHSVLSTQFQGHGKSLRKKFTAVPLALVCLLAELPHWFHHWASTFKKENGN